LTATAAFDEVRSPYSGDVVGRVPRHSAADARAAIGAAAAAMGSPLPAHRRAELLQDIADSIARNAEELAQMICSEAGKPIRAARGEVHRSSATYRAAADAARDLTGEVVPMDASPAGEGKLAFTLRVPVGVVAAISPFNFPLNLVAHKLAPALAAGCAAVLKPAPKR
jgi:acyl-CoA reductase-like NAD-dependent aldehyde dehydrogenase